MKISINGMPIELFSGAKIKHALLKTDEKLYKKVVSGEAVVQDQEGNETEINGAVGDGFSYFVVDKK
ncbi:MULTISPECIES: hypothetical protein [Bacillus]|uniref:hypothetical protein n=1 Tax=Bacillus TaxID=1386 RepID=UPI000BB9BBCC|nr:MULTISPECIES: hypothetical protein [Bacillus]